MEGPHSGVTSMFNVRCFDQFFLSLASLRVNHPGAMTTMEAEIISFLKQYPDSFFARKEIARKARHRSEYEADPHWAAAPLNSLVIQGQIVQNESGLYKLSDEYRDP